MELTPKEARRIIMKVGASGEPPEQGARHFSAGLDSYLEVLRRDYFQGILRDGLSAFKLVVGDYGSGKTHFLYCLRDVAWQENYAVSLVALNPRDCPFDKLELVYKEVVSNLMVPPSDPDLFDSTERGWDFFVDNWFIRMKDELVEAGIEMEREDLSARLGEYTKTIRNIDSSSFRQAVRQALLAMAEDDRYRLDLIQAWLSGESTDRYALRKFFIFEKIDKTTAFRMIRSLCQFIREIGYRGLVLMFDEGERLSSISGSRSKKIAYDNLRQVVDECGNSRLPGALFCYAVPNSFQEEIQTYEALRQRLVSNYTFSRVNPTGVEIDLEKLDLQEEELLQEIGRKLLRIYEIANDVSIPEREEFITMIAEETLKQTIDINQRRLFVKSLIEGLNLRVHGLRAEPETLVWETAKSLTEEELRKAEGEF